MSASISHIHSSPHYSHSDEEFARKRSWSLTVDPGDDAPVCPKRLARDLSSLSLRGAGKNKEIESTTTTTASDTNAQRTAIDDRMDVPHVIFIDDLDRELTDLNEPADDMNHDAPLVMNGALKMSLFAGNCPKSLPRMPALIAPYVIPASGHTHSCSDDRFALVLWRPDPFQLYKQNQGADATDLSPSSDAMDISPE
jgi:hypothetical protein